MVTIKSHTDLPQSKKLAEILPLESADMYYDDIVDRVTGELFIPDDGSTIKIGKGLNGSITAWSLAALLKYLKEIKPQVYTPVLFPYEGRWLLQFIEYGHGNLCETTSEKPVDACYELIIKLNELKML